MSGKTLLAFRSWGKHFLICFEGFSLRVHFMMFGTYRINERKETPVRLSLIFKLKKQWLVHTKKVCPLGHPIEKLYLGKTNRRVTSGKFTSLVFQLRISIIIQFNFISDCIDYKFVQHNFKSLSF